VQRDPRLDAAAGVQLDDARDDDPAARVDLAHLVRARVNRDAIARLAREPLAQFAVVAAVAFGLHAWRGPDAPTEVATDRRIVITPDFAAALRAQAERTQGPLDDAAFAAEINRFVDEEVMYREAIALHLDRGDVIVRRRLVQKMEFLLADEAQIAPPDDAALEAWIAGNADRYRVAARTTFTHVFFANDRASGDAEAAARAALEALRGGASDAMGDPFALGAHFTSANDADVDARLGDGFAEGYRAYTVDRWDGPLRSRYGWHLVRVEARDEATLPSLDVLRARATGDLVEDLRTRADRDAIAQLRGRYDIVVEGLDLRDAGSE
jgi:hypothetical protein